MKKCLIILITAATCVTACKSKKEIIPVKEMKFVMWDMLVADAWFGDWSMKDSTIRANKENLNLYQKVFDMHHVTKDAFYTSYKYYSSHPDEMKILMDSVNAYGGRLRDSATKANEPKPVPAPVPTKAAKDSTKAKDTVKPVLPNMKASKILRKDLLLRK